MVWCVLLLLPDHVHLHQLVCVVAVYPHIRKIIQSMFVFCVLYHHDLMVILYNCYLNCRGLRICSLCMLMYRLDVIITSVSSICCRSLSWSRRAVIFNSLFTYYKTSETTSAKETPPRLNCQDWIKTSRNAYVSIHGKIERFCWKHGPIDRSYQEIAGRAKRTAENHAITFNGISFSSSKQLVVKFIKPFNTSNLGRHFSSRETPY